MKSLKGIRIRYFALALALIVIALGIWQTFFKAQGYVKTDATIVSIEESEFSTEQDISYDVHVTFTVDGKEYGGLLGSYAPSYKVGKTVAIKYDPNDPSKFTDASGMSFVFLIIGAAILVVAIISWVLEKQKLKQLDKTKTATSGNVYPPSVPGNERELYFITDLGTPKYGHRIEDAGRNVLYEAKMTKFSLVQPFQFDFIDHEHGTTAPHLVGHTESYEWDSLFFDDHSTFTFDGELIWKLLKRNGISVDSSLSRDNLLKVQFKIYRDGARIADVTASGKYVHEDDAQKHGALTNALPAFGHYRVHTTETNLDLLFLTLMAFTRTESTTDEGGNRRTVWNTIKD